MSFIQRSHFHALLLSSVILLSPAFPQRRADDTRVIPPAARGEVRLVGITDTRIGPQITPHSGLPEIWRPENPLIFADFPSSAPPTTIRPGRTLAQQRAVISSYFPGISMDQWSPPDPTIAVGPNHIVATVNMKIAFYLKDGTLQYLKWLGNQEPNGFMAGIGALNFTFDPKCFYDAGSGRFFVVVPEQYTNPNRSWINIAVSDDSDPNGVWYFYRTNSVVVQGGNQYWVDYPGFGVDQRGVYVTGNLFGFSSGFLGAWWRCFDKTPMLAGQNTTFVDFIDTGAASVQAAQSTGNPPAAYFVNRNNSTSLRVHAVRDFPNNPTKVSTTVSIPSHATPSAGAPQQGTTSTLDTLDGRIMNVWWRNGRLIAAHAVRPSTATTRTIGRWYEVSTSNWPISGGLSLVQSGSIDDGRWKLFPAVAFNDFNDMGVVLGATSSTQYAGVYVTGRKRTDPPGATGALTPAKIGSAGYTGGRWGDYFGIQVDPADGLTFWGVGEFVDAANSWKTWITSWQVATYRQLTVTAKGGFQSPLGVFIDCTPDGRGLGGATAQYVRTYYDGENVTLTAQEQMIVGQDVYLFGQWVVGPVFFEPGQNQITFTLNSNVMAIAYYKHYRQQ